MNFLDPLLRPSLVEVVVIVEVDVEVEAEVDGAGVEEEDGEEAIRHEKCSEQVREGGTNSNQYNSRRVLSSNVIRLTLTSLRSTAT